MKMLPGLALGILALTRLGVAQDNPPRVLLQLLHCAKTDRFGFLDADLKKDGLLRSTYAHQVRSDPHVDEFFLVVYESASKGKVYVYSRERENRKTAFYLTNDAGFDATKKGFSFLEDPLYGIWTRNNIARNVKRALRNPTYSIPVRTILNSSPNVACHSYDE